MFQELKLSACVEGDTEETKCAMRILLFYLTIFTAQAKGIKVNFQKGDKAITEQQLILLSRTCKGKLWGNFNKPEGL